MRGATTFCHEKDPKRTLADEQDAGTRRPTMLLATSLPRAVRRSVPSFALLVFVWAAGCSAKYEAKPHACRPGTSGIGLGATFNLCPMIESVGVDPTSATVGTDIELSAIADDPDDLELSFRWVPSSGSVTDPTAPKTTFRCSEPGFATIAFTVSDGKCEDKQTVAVSCMPCSDAGACPDAQ
jgi:hypothetical protein